MSSSTKKITLKSSDGKTFEVDETVAFQSETIKLLKGDSDNREFHLEEVTGEILEKVIEYCKKHVDATDDDDDLKKWGTKFVFYDAEVETRLALVLAANYLKIKSLLNLTCQHLSWLVLMTPVERIWTNFVQNKINRSLLVEDEAGDDISRKIEYMALSEMERMKSSVN